jgi:hypothetical protein
MKVKVLLFALVVFGASACRHYTCPTYLKKDTKEVKTNTAKV